MTGTGGPEYGSLAPLVKVVGWLVSATAAILFSWKKNSDWEPVEQDLSKGAKGVGGVLTAIVIAVVWTQWADKPHEQTILSLTVWLGAATLLFLLLYGTLIAMLTFTEVASNETLR